MSHACGLADCSDGCIVKKRILFLMKRAHFPSWMVNAAEWCFASPSDTDARSYETLEDLEYRIEEFIRGGHSLYLHGPSGGGKSTWARRLCMAFFFALATSGKSRHLLIDATPAVIFTGVTDFFLRYKGSWTANSGVSQLYTMEEIYNAPLLVFDDIGVTAPSEYEKGVIHAIVNARMDNRKATVYTSNLDPDAFVNIFGQALGSRIIKASITVELRGLN
jgi:DNA replication protein DnaC